MLYLHARMFKYEIIILFYEFKFRIAKITISELEIVRSSMPTPISVSVMAKLIKICHVGKFKSVIGKALIY